MAENKLNVTYNIAGNSSSNNTLKITLPSPLLFSDGSGNVKTTSIPSGSSGLNTLSYAIDGIFTGTVTVNADIIQTRNISCGATSCNASNIISTSASFSGYQLVLEGTSTPVSCAESGGVNISITGGVAPYTYT